MVDTRRVALSIVALLGVAVAALVLGGSGDSSPPQQSAPATVNAAAATGRHPTPRPTATSAPAAGVAGDIRRASGSFSMGGGGEGRVHAGELVYLIEGPQDRDGAPSFLVQHWGEVSGAGVYPPTRFGWLPVTLIEERTDPHVLACPVAGPEVAPIAALQPFERFLCYGSSLLTFGPVRTLDYSFGRPTDGWLSDDGRRDEFLNLGYALIPDLSPALPIDRWVTVTGRFDDPSSFSCGDGEAVTVCRERFVITAAEEVPAPDFIVRGTWRPTTLPPAGGRTGHSMIWTGHDVFVWGGAESDEDQSVFEPRLPREGLRYDPTADRWSSTSPAPVDSVPLPVLAWTGSEVLVAGGHRFVGLAYDPLADTWRSLPTPPDGMVGPTVGGWVSNRLVVVTDTAAAAYDPQLDLWTVLPPAPVRPGWRTAAVAAGRLMVIAFGDGASLPVDGATIDPGTGTWTTVDVPLDPLEAGAEMFGAGDEILLPAVSMRYNVRADVWRPAAECHGATVGGAWTGRVLQGIFGQYDPRTDTCRQNPDPPARGAPFENTIGREFAVAVWTGRELVTWSGGTGGDIVVVPNDGAVFRPLAP